jgi:hypothetical protein
MMCASQPVAPAPSPQGGEDAAKADDSALPAAAADAPPDPTIQREDARRRLQSKLRRAVLTASTAQYLEKAARPAPQRGAMAGGPINASYAVAAQMGTPDDANWLERLRDRTLLFFVRHARVFDAFAGIAMLGLVGFGVLIVMAVLPLFFGISIFDWSDVRTQCTVPYLESIGNITQAGDAMKPPRIRLSGHAHDQWAAAYCTTAQRLFTMCVKAFTGIFSYINFLPIPWRLSIFMEAFYGR